MQQTALDVANIPEMTSYAVIVSGKIMSVHGWTMKNKIGQLQERYPTGDTLMYDEFCQELGLDLTQDESLELYHAYLDLD